MLACRCDCRRRRPHDSTAIYRHHKTIRVCCRSAFLDQIIGLHTSRLPATDRFVLPPQPPHRTYHVLIPHARGRVGRRPYRRRPTGVQWPPQRPSGSPGCWPSGRHARVAPLLRRTSRLTAPSRLSGRRATVVALGGWHRGQRDDALRRQVRAAAAALLRGRREAAPSAEPEPTARRAAGQFRIVRYVEQHEISAETTP